MHATCYAWGPAFKNPFMIPPFENIHIFPLISEILKLNIPDPVDGRLEVLENILKIN